MLKRTDGLAVFPAEDEEFGEDHAGHETADMGGIGHGQRVLISLKLQHVHEEVGVVAAAEHFAFEAVVFGMAF